MADSSYVIIDTETQEERHIRLIDNGFKNGSAGHLFWNFDNGGSDGYGYAGYEVSPRQQALYQTTRSYAKAKGYCPRMIVV